MGAKRYWNLRVVETRADDAEGGVLYVLAEVHYLNDQPTGWTPAHVEAEIKDNIRSYLWRGIEAMGKPVLREGDFK